MKKATKKRHSKAETLTAREVPPITYQPSKAELEADVSLPVTPERLACAVVSGGQSRREKEV